MYLDAIRVKINEMVFHNNGKQWPIFIYNNKEKTNFKIHKNICADGKPRMLGGYTVQSCQQCQSTLQWMRCMDLGDMFIWKTRNMIFLMYGWASQIGP